MATATEKMMGYISGFVPTGQEIDLSSRSTRLSGDRARQRPPLAGRGLAAFVLLLLGFCLLIVGGTMPAPQLPALSGRMPGTLSGEPIATVATLVGRSPDEAAQLLWDQGIRITGSQQSIGEIAADNGRSASEVLALLAPQERLHQTLID